MTPNRPIYLRCAPRGQRAGLAMAAVDGWQLNVVVLPKLWRSGAPRLVKAPDRSEDRRCLTIVGYEGDTISLDGMDEDLAETAAGAAAAAESRARGTGANTSAQTEDPALGALLTTIHGRSTEHSIAAETIPSGGLGMAHELLGLALLCDRARAQGSSGIESQFEPSPAAVTTAPWHWDTTAPSPVLQLLTAWKFVGDVGRRIREVRHGYHVEEEWLSSPRGRLMAKGILWHQATGEPRLLCCSDEFTQSTPLFRLIVTALDTIAAGDNVSGLLSRSSLADRVRLDAGRVRMALAHIPSAPIADACAAARHLRLGRLLREWAPIRATALDILQRRPPSCAEAAQGADGALLWTVDTSKLWERLLERGLHGSMLRGRIVEDYRADIDTPVKFEPDWNCLDPWHLASVEGAPECGNKRPDFLVLCRGRLVTRWVLDAKYKLRNGDQVDLPDRYQLFAYSHLAKVAGRPPKRGAILRPCRDAGGIRGSLIRADERFALDIVDLPFPKPDASLSDEAWSSCIERITNRLEELLDIGTLLNAHESTEDSALNLAEQSSPRQPGEDEPRPRTGFGSQARSSHSPPPSSSTATSCTASSRALARI